MGPGKRPEGRPAMSNSPPSDFRHGQIASMVALCTSALLACVKLLAGFFGQSYALIADGIESCADLLSTLVVWSALRISARPPDVNHPFGHGKAESLSGLLVGLAVLGAAAAIGYHSILEILTPHHAPRPWTLLVLIGVIGTKETLYRWVHSVGERIHSTALKSDALHHRADALTSVAALFGISIALIGGPGWESADDWAALLACVIIVYNGCRILRRALAEVMDEAAPGDVEADIRRIAVQHDAVLAVEKCRIRKSGLGLWMDIHVLVDGDLSVREGHAIGHAVQDALVQSELPIHDVVVHVEPHDAHPELVPGGNPT
jgi:cation diffusion facilitator family transporter